MKSPTPGEDNHYTQRKSQLGTVNPNWDFSCFLCSTNTKEMGSPKAKPIVVKIVKDIKKIISNII
jgi:hypothetical protein